MGGGLLSSQLFSGRASLLSAGEEVSKGNVRALQKEQCIMVARKNCLAFKVVPSTCVRYIVSSLSTESASENQVFLSYS